MNIGFDVSLIWY